MKNYYSLFFLFMILSCSQKIEEREIKAEIFDSIQIPLGDRVSPEPTSTQYFDSDSGEYLAIMNKILPSIEIYNLNFRESTKRFGLNRDGPNRIGSPNGFRIFSYDTILLASIPPQLMIFNFDGKKIGGIAVNDFENKVNYLSSTNEIPFLFDGKEVFAAQPYFQNFFYMKQEEAAEYKHVYKISLSQIDGKAEWLPISHPPDLWENGKKTEQFAWCDRGDTIIISPLSDHRLWLISKSEGKILGYKDVRSAFVNKFQIIDKLPEGDIGIIESLASDRYELIKYDSYRDVFYRFFLVGVDWEEYNVGYRDLFSSKPKVGVMVLDKNLKVIGEHVFEDHYVQARNYFVGRNGLYVSTNNTLRDDFDKNFLKYDIIRFVGLTYEE